MYVPSQFNFELKIYKFTDAFLSGTVDRLCTRYIREWLEFPLSSCVSEWASAPTNFCGLGIPSFAQRAARMGLIRNTFSTPARTRTSGNSGICQEPLTFW